MFSKSAQEIYQKIFNPLTTIVTNRTGTSQSINWFLYEAEYKSLRVNMQNMLIF